MIYYAAIPLTLFVVVLQLAAAPSFSYFGVHADLPIVWLSCWAVLRDRRETTILIAVAAFALGALGQEPFGASFFALLPIIGLARLADPGREQHKLLAALLVTLVTALLFPIINGAASAVGGGHVASPLVLLRIALRAAPLDVVTTLIWFWPMRLIFAQHVSQRGFRRA